MLFMGEIALARRIQGSCKAGARAASPHRESDWRGCVLNKPAPLVCHDIDVRPSSDRERAGI